MTLRISLVALLVIILTTPVMADSVLIDFNKYRVEHGIYPVIEDKRLCKLARIRAKQIQTEWSHKQFFTEITKTNISGRFYENLAYGFKKDEVVMAWASSGTHKEIMLVKDMSLGCIVSIGAYYVFEGVIENK